MRPMRDYCLDQYSNDCCLEILKYEYTDQDEVNFVIETAKARNDIKRENGIKSNKKSEDLTDLQVDIIGTTTEAPVIKICGGTWDHFSKVSLRGDGGTDTKICNMTSQIRGRNNWCWPWLYYDEVEDFKTDIAILCGGKDLHEPKVGTIVRMIGWITKEDFAEKHVRENLGQKSNGGWRCICKPELNHFRPMKELVNWKFSNEELPK